MITRDPIVWARLSALYDEASEATADQRAQLLERLRREEPVLAGKLVTLLAARERAAAAAFLEQPPQLPPVEPVQERVAGERVGPFSLLRVLGRGGMGVVCLAERADGLYERQVALKLPADVLLSSGLAQRFARERQILADLQHPHIAALLDAGVDSRGQPYLALEYVDGLPITEYCRARALDLRGRVLLLEQVCEALQYAHSRLIVHRDLKPSNILITQTQGVRLLDFGVAKLLDDTPRNPAPLLTRLAGLAYTLEYAAPEQIEGGSVTTATDIWGFGVVMYQLLCGRLPFDAPDRTRRALEDLILHQDPVAPNAGDLDTIVLKALKKQPAERYPTAAALASDLRAWREERPISARPDSALYVARKFVRRNRLVVAAAAMTLGAIVAGLAVATFEWQAAEKQRVVAQAATERTRAGQEFLSFLLTEGAASDRPINPKQLLERGAKYLESQRQGSTDVRAELSLALANDFDQLDAQEPAARLDEAAYRLAARSEDASLRVRATCASAGALAISGHPQESAARLREARVTTLDRSPEADRARLQCQSAAVVIAVRDSNPAAGLAAAEEMIHILEADGPVISPDLAFAWNALGRARYRAARVVESIAAYDRALAMLEQLGRAETARAAIVLGNRGVSQDRSGRPAAALADYTRAAEIYTQIGDQGVPGFLLINLSYTHMILDDLPKAVTLARSAVAAESAHSGPQSMGAGAAWKQLGAALVRSGEYAQASLALDRAEQIYRQSSPGGRDLATSLRYRALMALFMGQDPQARQFVEKALEIDGYPADRTWVDTPTVLDVAARVALAQNRISDAVVLASDTVQRYLAQTSSGARSYRIACARMTLGEALAQDRRASSEAHEQFSQAYAIFKATFGADHPTTRQALERLNGQSTAAPRRDPRGC